MTDASFSDWALEWLRLARYVGANVTDVDRRIDSLLELWHRDIPGVWRRGQDERLLDPDRRYCRGNDALDARRRGEHAIEYELLQPDPSSEAVDVLGAQLVDGVKAVPLAQDAAGGRVGNVEADMLLLVRNSRRVHRLEMVEVKVTANNAWFASIENLRQLRLLKESEATRMLFAKRRPDLGLRRTIGFSGIVLAPAAFYEGRGKQGLAVTPAQKLLDRMRSDAGVHVRLAVWDSGAIRRLEHGVGLASATVT